MTDFLIIVLFGHCYKLFPYQLSKGVNFFERQLSHDDTGLYELVRLHAVMHWCWPLEERHGVASGAPPARSVAGEALPGKTCRAPSLLRRKPSQTLDDEEAVRGPPVLACGTRRHV